MYSYTVGVKKGLFFKKYRRVVKNHFMNDTGGAPFDLRLVLNFENGSELSLSGIDRADVKMYPDFAQAMKNYERDKIEAERNQAAMMQQAPEQQQPQVEHSIHQLARERGIM